MYYIPDIYIKFIVIVISKEKRKKFHGKSPRFEVQHSASFTNLKFQSGLPCLYFFRSKRIKRQNTTSSTQMTRILKDDRRFLFCLR
jgi:hypothetical protein